MRNITARRIRNLAAISFDPKKYGRDPSAFKRHTRHLKTLYLRGIIKISKMKGAVHVAKSASRN
jgi:hypothetical protein